MHKLPGRLASEACACKVRLVQGTPWQGAVVARVVLWGFGMPSCWGLVSGKELLPVRTNHFTSTGCEGGCPFVVVTSSGGKK